MSSGFATSMLSGWLCLRARSTSYSSEPGLGRATAAADGKGEFSGVRTPGRRPAGRAARRLRAQTRRPRGVHAKPAPTAASSAIEIGSSASRLAVRRLPDHAENHIAAWYLQQFSPRCKADQRRSPGLAALEKFARPTLRRALGGGYRREDVEFALAELRLTLRQLDNDLESLGDRNRELESELVVARSEIEGYRSKELELNDQISAAIRRACEIEEKAQARAREIIGDAEEIARRARLELHKQIEDTSNHFDELLRRKEGLLEAMLGVVGDFDQAIARVELAELLPAATAASALPAPAPQPEPAPAVLSIPEPPP